MRSKQHLNGSDYLMLGFDYELRKHGFAGNSCQIVLQLGAPIPPETLQRRIDRVWEQYPILGAQPAGLVRPHWRLSNRDAAAPRVRVHCHEPGLKENLFNEPLAVSRGELARFDLVHGAGKPMEVVFTWTHALMDAPGAEHFLATVGREDLPSPSMESVEPSATQLSLIEKFRVGWKSLYQLDDFSRKAPRPIGIRHPETPARLHYRVERFSAAETALVRANAVRQSGLLGDAQFHVAVSALELHRLHQRLGRPSPGYVIPLPVGLRLKGRIEPLFSNQVTMLMLQFLPGHLDSIASAAATMKQQSERAMREGLLESGRILSNLFRFLPLPIYTAVLKQGLKGEICSLFFGDTAAASPLLNTFLGAPIEDFTHVAAVTPSPGLGVIFYYFGGQLRFTVLHSTTVLNDAEAAEFASDIRSRLLNP
jgi:hypothetical protein